MVTSYMKLLSERYGDQLDVQAEKYIHFAMGGAKRMQHLRVGGTIGGVIAIG